MTTRQEVAQREPTEVQAKTREQELVLAPAVDIFENADGITAQAEMSGVSKDRLNIQADRNSLLIEGDVVIEMPAGIEALYADVQATKYRRSFVLSGELETERIEANLKDGLLTVRIRSEPSFAHARLKCARLDSAVRPVAYHDRPDGHKHARRRSALVFGRVTAPRR
jgi:HSP20 family protein